MKKSDVRFKMGGGKTLLLGFALLVIALVVTSCEQPDNTPVAVDSITINGLETTDIVFEEGTVKEIRLTVDVQLGDATDKTVKWASNKPDIASVSDNGIVVINGAGDVIITAQAVGKSASASFEFGEGYFFYEVENIYYTWNEEGLLAWNAYVTTNGDYSNPERLKTNVVLLDNITLPAPKEGQTSNWTPVGYYNYSSHVAYYYAGTFDGGGHTISNLKINLPNTHDLGLFGGVAETAVVKDLTLSDVEISGNNYIGGIAGNNYGTIENCNVSGSVSGTYDVGGIVGANYGTIKACYNTCNVSGTEAERVGGIAGFNEGEISGCTNSAQVSAKSNGLTYAGGITGYNSGNILTSCNEGTIEAFGGDMACSGGIVGYNRGNITETCNEGSVSAECVKAAYTYEFYKGGFAGGIVGYCAVGTIAASHNEAEVYAKCMLSGDYYMVCAGGVIGFTDYTESIVACYNSGEFSGESSERPIYLGGIVGYFGPGTTTACYNTGTGKVVEGNWVYNGGITGGINSGTLQSNYWEKGTEETPKFGIGSNDSNDNATEVDGSEGNTWADALSDMNNALSESDYQYTENTDTETNGTMPLVIEKKSSN